MSRGQGQEDPRAGAAADRGARRGRAHGARRSASAVGETVGYRVRFGSKVSRATRIEVVTEGIFTRHDPRRSRARPASPRCCSTNSTSARSMPTSGWRWRATCSTGLREDLRILVMSATIDGARVAKLLGDAPVIDSAGRAFPVETRYLGREPRAPIERQMADAVAQALRAEPARSWRSCRARPKSAAPRLCCASACTMPSVEIVPLLWRARCRACRTAPLRRRRGPPQGGAGDVDRRDLAHHRGRAHRGRFRRSRGCRAMSLTSA